MNAQVLCGAARGKTIPLALPPSGTNPRGEFQVINRGDFRVIIDTRQRNGCGVAEEMARRLSMATRRELKDAIRQRYQGSSDRRERGQILSEFVRVTGYHRKHALRELNRSSAPVKPRQRERLYDEE